jgi:hypothetical protein
VHHLQQKIRFKEEDIMKIFKRLILMSVVVFVFFVGVTAHSAENYTEKFIKMGTSSSGGIFNALGVALCQMWSDEIEGVKFTAMVTGGSGANSLMIGKKDVQVAMIEGRTAFDAYRGVGTFEGKQSKNLRVIANLFPAVVHFVSSKARDMNSPLDYKGKKLNIGTPGSGSENTSLVLLKYFDLEPDKNFSARHMKHSSAAAAMGDEKIDGYIQQGGLGISHQMQALASGKAKILPIMPDEIRKKITGDNPIFYDFIIPKDIYPNQDYEVLTLATPTFLAVGDEVSEKLVYDMTKEMFENRDALIRAHSAAKQITLDGALKGQIIPLHPGAERYYKEVGIIKK